MICEALGAIGSLQPETLMVLLGDILKLLNELSAITNPTSQQIDTKVLLCTLVFQTLSGYQWNSATTGRELQFHL